MDVRSILGLLAPTTVGAHAKLNQYRNRVGIVVPLERATIHRWYARESMPSKWLQVAGIAVLEEHGPAGFARFAAAMLDLEEVELGEFAVTP
jgi:hypothetical protein